MITMLTCKEFIPRVLLEAVESVPRHTLAPASTSLPMGHMPDANLRLEEGLTDTDEANKRTLGEAARLKCVIKWTIIEKSTLTRCEHTSGRR
jgi:hypothetical protein